jgi:hypothetical protein
VLASANEQEKDQEDAPKNLGDINRDLYRYFGIDVSIHDGSLGHASATEAFKPAVFITRP